MEPKGPVRLHDRPAHDVRVLSHDITGRRAREHVQIDHSANDLKLERVLVESHVHAVRIEEHRPVSPPVQQLQVVGEGAVQIGVQYCRRFVSGPESEGTPSGEGMVGAGRLSQSKGFGLGGERHGELDVLVFE